MRMMSRPIFKPASGGGGGGPLVLPTTDLVFQYDFSALALSNNDAISTVEDLVGSNDLSQTGGNRPTFKTGIMPNGKAVARFDGTDDFLIGASTATYKHLFMILKCTGAGSVFPTYDGVFSGTLNSGEYTYVGTLSGSGFFDTSPSSTFVKSGTTTSSAPFANFELCHASRATNFSFIPSVGKDREFTTRYFTGDIAGIFAYSSIQSGTPLTDIVAAVLDYYGV